MNILKNTIWMVFYIVINVIILQVFQKFSQNINQNINQTITQTIDHRKEDVETFNKNLYHYFVQKIYYNVNLLVHFLQYFSNY